MSKLNDIKDKLSKKGTKLRDFMGNKTKAVAFQGNKLISNLKKATENFSANLKIEEKSYTPEEREAYNEEMIRQIEIENSYSRY